MSQYYQATVSKLLHDSLLKLCSENIPYDRHLEIDGIICISTGDEHNQIVVKVHEVVENIQSVVWPEEPVDLSKEEIAVQVKEDQSEVYDLSKEPRWRETISDNVKGKYKVKQEISCDIQNEGDPVAKKSNGLLEELSESYESSEHKDRPSYNGTSDTDDELSDTQGDSNAFKYTQSSSVILPFQEIVPPSKRRVGRYKVPQFDPACIDGAPDVGCRYCAQRFPSYASLVSHNLEAHRRYSCSQCPNTFSLQCNLRRHERLHRGSKPFVCGMCEKTFSRNGDLKAHELKHRVDNDLCNVQCRRCSQLFVSRVAYKEHVCRSPARSHKKLKTLDNIFSHGSHIQENGIDKKETKEDAMAFQPEPGGETPGSSSSVGFDVSGGLVNGHVTPLSKPQSPYSYSEGLAQVENKYANFSSMDFLSFVALQIDAHENSLKQMKEDNQPKCVENSYLTSATAVQLPDCSAVLLSPEAKPKVIETTEAAVKPETAKAGSKSSENLGPSEEKVYLCKMCKTQWNGYRAYDQHCQKRHLRYPCHLCDQTFTNKNNRSRHVRNHMGQKVYNCSECGKNFSRSDTLKEHQIIHTEGYIGDKCHYCGLNIKKKAELLSHIKKCARINKSF